MIKLENLRGVIEDLLRSTGREGIDNVIEQLSEGGFYTVPASVKFHNNFAGGLAYHSFQVYEIAIKLFNELKHSNIELPFGEDSVILCSLLHDVCKMNEYEMWFGVPRHTRAFRANKTKNHGTKSVDLLTSWGLQLTNEEKKAIHWHMGGWAKNAPKIYGHSYFIASVLSVFVNLIHTADSWAAHKNSK